LILSGRGYCDPHPINAQSKSSGGIPMANVVKKHSIASELAQKMVDQAVAKAKEIGVAENVAILDDGGNLKAFCRVLAHGRDHDAIAQCKAAQGEGRNQGAHADLIR